MKPIIAGLALVTIGGMSAQAADMAVKAPIAPVVAVHGWTGLYVGLNAGGVWGSTDIDYRASDFGFSGPAGAALLNSVASGKIESSGFTAGTPGSPGRCIERGGRSLPLAKRS